MKHVYLIIAHNEFEVLRCLVSALDDERNDIFIHFDKKVTALPSLKAKASSLYILENRIDVRWGDLSVVEAEYALFQEATRNGKYMYYHLLSGVDMPLKSQDEIHDFFHQHQGREFIGFSQYDYRGEVDRKVNRYQLFPKDFRPSSNFVNAFHRIFRALFLRLQFLVHFRRNTLIEFKKGTQWMSVTDDFVRFLLSKESEVAAIYHHTFCSDEIFAQTLCWNSDFRNKIYNINNEAEGCLRKIGWRNGQLVDWTMADYHELMQSDTMFARKFNSQNMEVVYKLSEKINEDR